MEKGGDGFTVIGNISEQEFIDALKIIKPGKAKELFFTSIPHLSLSHPSYTLRPIRFTPLFPFKYLFTLHLLPTHESIVIM